jgi:hypothetical protein
MLQDNALAGDLERQAEARAAGKGSELASDRDSRAYGTAKSLS